MSRIKTTGAEWKAFMDEPWPEDKAYDDETVFVDGMEFDCMTPHERIPDASAVLVEGGVVDDGDGNSRTLAAEFRAWRKRRDTVTMVVTCSKSAEELLRDAVRAAGGSIK